LRLLNYAVAQIDFIFCEAVTSLYVAAPFKAK